MTAEKKWCRLLFIFNYDFMIISLNANYSDYLGILLVFVEVPAVPVYRPVIKVIMLESSQRRIDVVISVAFHVTCCNM